MQYDSGYDVVQGVFLGLYSLLFIACALQRTIEFRLLREKRAYEYYVRKMQGSLPLVKQIDVNNAGATNTCSSWANINETPTIASLTKAPPSVGALQKVTHRLILVAVCFSIASLVDPFSFRGLIDVKFVLFFGNMSCSVIVALACFVLYTWIQIHYTSSLQEVPIWIEKVLVAVGVGEFMLLLAFSLFRITCDYHPWLTGAVMISLAASAFIILAVMGVSVIHLRRTLHRAASFQVPGAVCCAHADAVSVDVNDKFYDARRRMTTFMVALFSSGTVAISLIGVGAADRLNHPESYTEDYPASVISTDGVEKIAFLSIQYAFFLCFFWYAYLPMEYLWSRPWAKAWDGFQLELASSKLQRNSTSVNAKLSTPAVMGLIVSRSSSSVGAFSAAVFLASMSTLSDEVA